MAFDVLFSLLERFSSLPLAFELAYAKIFRFIVNLIFIRFAEFVVLYVVFLFQRHERYIVSPLNLF